MRSRRSRRCRRARRTTRSSSSTGGSSRTPCPWQRWRSTCPRTPTPSSSRSELMSTYLRKCLDIAPTAVITPGPDVANDYRNLRLQPWWPALRATTSHLRLIADWPSLQHAPGTPGAHPSDVPCLDALDQQLAAAHADGMKIILFPYRYP